MTNPCFEDLPKSYEGLDVLQSEFNAYQQKAFQPRTPQFFSLELCGEAGELANLEKKAWKGRDIPPEQFAEEAADTCIALLNYANQRGVNLAEAVRRKMHEIEERRQQSA